jgi:RES domain-containing protein
VASPPGWSAQDAIQHLTVRPWTGAAWRWHSARRDPVSVRGSEIVSGRYHRARAQAPTGPVWRALYLGLSTGACLGEAMRYLGSAGARGSIGRRLTKFQVSLDRVLDLRDARRLGLAPDDLTADQDWSVVHPPSLTQQLAHAALQRGAEGLIVPAASLVDDNLVALIDNLLPASAITVDSFVDPRLYVARS